MRGVTAPAPSMACRWPHSAVSRPNTSAATIRQYLHTTPSPVIFPLGYPANMQGKQTAFVNLRSRLADEMGLVSCHEV